MIQSEEIPIQYTILEEKHIGDTSFKGSFVELSAKGAKVRVYGEESYGVPSPLCNIKLNLLTAIDKRSTGCSSVQKVCGSALL